jgi:hypothetical protein
MDESRAITVRLLGKHLSFVVPQCLRLFVYRACVYQAAKSGRQQSDETTFGRHDRTAATVGQQHRRGIVATVVTINSRDHQQS